MSRNFNFNLYNRALDMVLEEQVKEELKTNIFADSDVIKRRNRIISTLESKLQKNNSQDARSYYRSVYNTAINQCLKTLLYECRKTRDHLDIEKYDIDLSRQEVLRLARVNLGIEQPM